MYVQPAHGGVLCPRCRGEGRTYVASRATLEQLIGWQRTAMDASDPSGLEMTPGVAAEARIVLRSFFAGNLTAPLASERLLEDL
jgi:hypothetical protein